MIKRNIYSFVTIFSITLLSFVACGDQESTTDNKTDTIKVKAKVATIKKVPTEYVFTGNIEGDKKVKLSTKIIGNITYMPFEEGTKISVGQSLIKIKSTDLEAKKSQINANLAEAEAAFNNAEINYTRMKNLYEKKSATKKEFDDTETAYNIAQAKIKAIQSMEKEVNDHLSYTNILSPIDGYIVQKLAEQGDLATPGVPLLVVEDLKNLKVVTKVPENQVALFEKGNKVKVIVDALNNLELNGIVEQINPAGNSSSRQFNVKIRIFESNNNLENVKSGMYAKVALIKGYENMITIPETWIVERGQLKGIYTINNLQEASLRWIRTGKKIADEIEVLSGLSQGEQIIAFAENVRDGQKVEVVE